MTRQATLDGRNWLRRQPIYDTLIHVRFIYPDEWDLVEHGPRVALAIMREAVGPWPSFQEWQYRPTITSSGDG